MAKHILCPGIEILRLDIPLVCLCLVGVISLVRGIHYEFHEAHVAQIERAIRRFEGVEDLADFLGEFSSPTMLVWSYRQGDDDAVMPPEGLR